MSNLDGFTHQLDAMYGRLEKLYAAATQLPGTQDYPHHIVPLALKELGVAAEELHVANEELQLQNERACLELNDAIARGRYYENLFRYAPQACLVTTNEGKILEANLATAQLLNVNLDHLLGKLLISFVPIDYRNTFRLQLNYLQNSNASPHVWSCYFQPRNCDLAEIEITISRLPSSSPGRDEIYWVLKDASSIVATKVEFYDGTVSEQDAIGSRPVFSYRKREIIPLNPQTIWQVKEGIVKLSSFTADYEEVLLGLVSTPAPFSIGSMFLPAYQAVAVTDVKLVRLSFNEVNSSPDLARLLVSQLHQRLQQAEVLLNISGQRRVKDRLYFLLQFLRREIGEPVANGTRLQIRMIHEDIASACCSTRVTVTRILSELQKQEKIEIDSDFHIVLKNDF
jgi:CRP-like cAMP-binding protein/PAS domain-containing protein